MKTASAPSWLPALAIATACLVSSPSKATPLVLDNFTTPGAAQSVVSPTQDLFQFTDGSFAGLAGQRRDAYYWLYDDPAHNGATATVGGGAASVRAGAGALGEFAVAYGADAPAFGHLDVQGPALGLDLSAFNNFQALFSSSALGLNLIVGFYTTNPHLDALGNPLYYWDGEMDISPGVPGGPVTANLGFTGGDAEHFNFSQVDGIVFIIDRTSNVFGNSYDLSSLQFTQTVPEPAPAALLLAGILAAACARRLRSK
jgi:hypothetical protein